MSLGYDPGIFLEEGLTPRFYGAYKSPQVGGFPGPGEVYLAGFEHCPPAPYNIQCNTVGYPASGVPEGSFVWDWANLLAIGLPRSGPLAGAPEMPYPDIGGIWISTIDEGGNANSTGTDVSGGFSHLTTGQKFRVLGKTNAINQATPTNLLFEISSAPVYWPSLTTWEIPVTPISGSWYVDPVGSLEEGEYDLSGPERPMGGLGQGPFYEVVAGVNDSEVHFYGFDPAPNDDGGGNGGGNGGGEDPGDGGGDPGGNGGGNGGGGGDPGGGSGDGGGGNPPMTTTIQSPDDATANTFDVPRGRSPQSIYTKLLNEMESSPGVLGNSPHSEYKEILRFLIARFSGLKYSNEEQKIISVKCTHARPERAIAKLNQQQNIILPTATIAQTSIEEADNRRRAKPMLIQETLWDDIKQRAERVIRFVDRPVNLIYTLNIWAKYLEDMDQLAEQVRLMFNPVLAVETPYDKHTPAFMTSESDNSSMVLADREDRIVRRAFTIKVETYIKSPLFKVTSTGEIQRFNIEVPIVDC